MHSCISNITVKCQQTFALRQICERTNNIYHSLCFCHFFPKVTIICVRHGLFHCEISCQQMLCSNRITPKWMMTNHNSLGLKCFPLRGLFELNEKDHLLRLFSFRPICALKSDYPPQDLLCLEVVTLHREISKAVYCLHSGSMKRDEGSVSGGGGGGLMPFTLQEPALEHKHPLHSYQTAPHKAAEES